MRVGNSAWQPSLSVILTLQPRTSIVCRHYRTVPTTRQCSPFLFTGCWDNVVVVTRDVTLNVTVTFIVTVTVQGVQCLVPRWSKKKPRILALKKMSDFSKYRFGKNVRFRVIKSYMHNWKHTNILSIDNDIQNTSNKIAKIHDTICFNELVS